MMQVRQTTTNTQIQNTIPSHTPSVFQEMDLGNNKLSKRICKTVTTSLKAWFLSQGYFSFLTPLTPTLFTKPKKNPYPHTHIRNRRRAWDIFNSLYFSKTDPEENPKYAKYVPTLILNFIIHTQTQPPQLPTPSRKENANAKFPSLFSAKPRR